MPHLRIRSIETDQIVKLSQGLFKELAAVMETSEDNFTLEKVESTYFQDGNKVATDPYIEILWFDRGQAIQDQAAKVITDKVRRICDCSYITVVFTALPKTSYYENGKHF